MNIDQNEILAGGTNMRYKYNLVLNFNSDSKKSDRGMTIYAGKNRKIIKENYNPLRIEIRGKYICINGFGFNHNLTTQIFKILKNYDTVNNSIFYTSLIEQNYLKLSQINYELYNRVMKKYRYIVRRINKDILRSTQKNRPSFSNRIVKAF